MHSHESVSMLEVESNLGDTVNFFFFLTRPSIFPMADIAHLLSGMYLNMGP